ncbi:MULTISPECIES: hypothetical protein [unclassified Paenibacillus]|uniref:hypothetical protein n=1 Tax=unclassified Paenibacillus TaxID=185978 RepID=UPI00089917D7|nr:MULTISPECIES: hypothetical protein [unclassified Paenibacillus]SDW54812.1 hypothetical protein SAMN05518848_102125 [Paenibacillus sp. PDC88]
MFNVVIKAWKNDEVIETITKEPVSERSAERIERGVNINLNHDEYYTEVVPA